MTALQQETDGVGPWWANEMFRSLINDVVDIVAIVEKDGRFVFVNEAIHRVLGWEPALLIGTNSFDLLHPDDRARIATLVGHPDRRNEGQLYEARYCHRDGSCHVLEARGKRTGENGRLVITARDISKRLEAEEALRESQRRLKSVVNNMPVIMWTFDRHGIYTFSDGKGLQALGTTPGAIVGQSILATARSPEVLAAAKRALQGEEFSFIAHVQGLTFDTRYAPILDENGEYDGSIGVANDITARWNAEQQTRLQASILDEIQQGSMVVNCDFQVVYWNRAAERLLGWPPEEVKGRDVRAILAHSEKEHAAITAISQQVFSGSPWNGEFELMRRDGVRFSSFITLTPMRDADGSNSGFISIIQDISEQKQTEMALRASEERYAIAASGSNAGLWDWDLERDRIYYSDRWKSMLGHAPEVITDSSEEWFNRIHPNDLDLVRDRLDEHLRGEVPFEVEYRIMHEDGTFRWMSASGVAVKGRDGRPLRVAGSQTDITERKVAEEQLLKSAFYDTLTGLPNRALFLDRLERMLSRARRRPDYNFALLFLDLDRFKNVNDSLGHGSGDILLVRVTQRLESCIRTNDTFARLGGDEFAILLDDVRDIKDATQLAERMQKELTTPLPVDGHDIFVSASIGIAWSRRDIAAHHGDMETDVEALYSSPEEMLRDADTAMYRAKSLGKARHEIFNRAMHTRAFEMLKLESDLRRAIERNELETHYQPIVSLAGGTLAGFEALVRWRHPERGLVPPGDFIPIAEDSGLILPLGQWVLRDVCAQMRHWHDQGIIDGCSPTVAVNISSRQFSQPGLVADVRSILDEFQIQPCDVKLEITESVIMENRESAAAMLQELKNLGVHLSIDDFGTGYSSLASLYQFPLSTLKIDRSFVQRLGDDGQNAEIVRTILLLARNLNMSVIAEGIETASQFSVLRALGCDCGQGYLFSRPVPVPQAQKLISASSYWWQTQTSS